VPPSAGRPDFVADPAQVWTAVPTFKTARYCGYVLLAFACTARAIAAPVGRASHAAPDPRVAMDSLASSDAVGAIILWHDPTEDGRVAT
jgi:hypothetical protein